VTTDKVSRDAKRVFDELARETQGRGQIRPIYIEGLDKVVDDFVKRYPLPRPAMPAVALKLLEQ
jgi:hypothetical protein